MTHRQEPERPHGDSRGDIPCGLYSFRNTAEPKARLRDFEEWCRRSRKTVSRKSFSRGTDYSKQAVFGQIQKVDLVKYAHEHTTRSQ